MIGAIIPIALLIQSGFKLVGLVHLSPGLVSPCYVPFYLLFSFLRLSMHVLVAIGSEVDAIKVKEVKAVAVSIG